MLNNEIRVVMESVGGYLPEKIFSNDYLKDIYKAQFNEEIIEISTRHVAGDNEILADISVKAAKKCLSNNNIQDIQCLILASMTPDNRGIATAPVIAHKLALGDVPAFDVRAGEAGGLVALQNAVTLIKSGQYKKILVIAADINSKYINYQNSKDAQLYGDGAVAILLSDNICKGLAEYQASYFDSFDEFYSAKILPVGGCDNYFKITEKRMFKQDDLYWNIDYEKLEKFAQKTLDHIFDLNLCSSRTSNKYFLQLMKPDIIDNILEKYKIDKEKVVNCFNMTGDIGTGTTYFGLLYAFENKLLTENECLLMISYGTGGNYGIINWIWRNNEEGSTFDE